MNRREAIFSNSKTYTDTAPCARGHVGLRYTHNYTCVECQALKAKQKKLALSPEEKAVKLEKRNAWQQAKAAKKKLITDAKEAKRQECVKTLMAEIGLDLKIVRQEAKDAGEEFYFTGKPCSQGHICKRHVAGGCYECHLKYRRDNMNKTRAARPEEMKVRKKAEYHRNSAARRPHVSAYGKANREKIRLRSIGYRKRRPEVHREIGATRRARKRHATPPWLTKEMREEIKAMHKQAAAMQAELGVQFDLDHIVQLDGGGAVCGLHVPWNLRIMTHSENTSRPKKFTDSPIARYAPMPLGGGAALEHYQL